MTETKITFITKEYKPHANSMSPMGGPVFIDIEETNFPTKKGKKKVGRIKFFPNSGVSEEDIKKALQMSGDEVKKLTFEIEIDGEQIEADDNSGFSSHTASASHSASSFSASASISDSKPEPKND